MWSREAKAPTYDELRPFGPRESAGFPVYRDLEGLLLSPGPHPRPEIAHVMATCAAYAYAGPEVVSMIMARLGLENNLCRAVGMSVDAMLLRSTAFVIQSGSGRVAILCYRGTEPLNLINWLVNLDLDPERMSYRTGGPCTTVHGGFYRNTRATRYEVMNLLGDMGDDLEALYITGHSLGGAMAALMGVMIRYERRYRNEFADRLRAVYTFGQPMIGDPAFADSCQTDEFLGQKVIRYVYDNDIVPHLPPAASGPYQHFGREYRYRVPHLRNAVNGLLGPFGDGGEPREGKWRESTRPVSQAQGVPSILLANMAFLTEKFQLTRLLPSLYSVEDHFPRHYITSLTPYGVSNEYGD